MSGGEPLVLVADDNVDIVRLLSARLSRRGYEVITAADGDQALEQIRRRMPAIAVLDWVMPGLSGPEVCARTKEASETAATRVVLLSARATDRDAAEGMSYGADAYLTKPFDIDDLDTTLRALLAG